MERSKISNFRSPAQLQIKCLGDSNATCTGLYILKNKDTLASKSGDAAGILNLKLNLIVSDEKTILNTIVGDDNIIPNVTMLKVYGRSHLNDLVSISLNVNSTETMVGDSPAAGLWISSRIREMITLKHIPSSSANISINKSNETKPKFIFLQKNVKSNLSNTSKLGSFSFQSKLLPSESNRIAYGKITFLRQFQNGQVHFEAFEHNKGEMLSMVAREKVLEIDHTSGITITRPTNTGKNGDILRFHGQTSINGKGGRVIVRPGKSQIESDTSKLKLESGSSQVHIWSTSLEFKNANMQLNMDSVMHLPVSTMENDTRMFFQGADDILSVSQKNVQDSTGTIHIQTKVTNCLNISKNMKTSTTLSTGRLVVNYESTEISVTLKNNSFFNFSDNMGNTIISIEEKDETVNKPHVNIYNRLSSEDTNGAILKNRFPIKYISTEQDVDFSTVYPRSIVTINRTVGATGHLNLDFTNVNTDSPSWDIFVAETYTASDGDEVYLSFKHKTRVIVNVKMYTKHPTDNVVPIYINEEWGTSDKFVCVCKELTTLPGSHLKILKLKQYSYMNKQNVYTIKGSLYYDTNKKAFDAFIGKNAPPPKYYKESAPCLWRKAQGGLYTL